MTIQHIVDAFNAGLIEKDAAVAAVQALIDQNARFTEEQITEMAKRSA